MSRPFAVELGGQLQEVDLAALLDARQIDGAETAANRWIKQLRHCRVDGSALRDRFTHRGDSLWWFAELYLHKMRIVSRAHRALAALETLAARPPGARWLVDGSDHVVGHLAHQVARRHGIACEGSTDSRRQVRGTATRAKAMFLAASAQVERLRPRRGVRLSSRPRVAAFVHSAFAAGGPGDEAYLGPVLREIASRVPDGALQLVGLGPATNFRVRGWRDRAREFLLAGANAGVVPVAAFASRHELEPSRLAWHHRGAILRALRASEDLRAASAVDGYDLWPLVEEELAGVADLQFPWSARAMDEAGAALDALSPGVVVTYAEAGGWGRALVLEARRRGIPAVALQHGFIYRHWLNYQHEPDEMAPSAANAHDRGFPRPDCTLVFDELTRRHLIEHAHFPAGSVQVTGSARLDAIVAAARATTAGRRAEVRRRLGADEHMPIALVAAKHAQLGDAYPALVEAARAMPDLRLVVKPHPAEGAAPYLAGSAGVPNVVVAPPDLDLGVLTTVASVVVTANSTAAIEAMPLGVPALIVTPGGNLAPFVEAGVMAGVQRPAEIAGALQALLYDRKMRLDLESAQGAFMRRHRIEADGGAARRAADAILSLART